MSDPRKSFDKMTAKAAFDAAAGAASRALADATSTEEERAARKAREAEEASRRRKKYLALAIVGLLVVLGAIGLAIHFWYWFLLAGVIGALALYGQHHVRKSRATREERKQHKVEVVQVDAQPRASAPRVQDPPRASPEPTASDLASVEDELAALKARLKK